MENANQAKAGFGGLFTGFLMGLLTGLLYAPKKGEELRSDIANKVGEGQKKLEDAIHKGQEKAETELKDLRTRLNSLSEKTGESLETEKDALERKIEKYVKKASDYDELEKRVKQLEKQASSK